MGIPMIFGAVYAHFADRLRAFSARILSRQAFQPGNGIAGAETRRIHESSDLKGWIPGPKRDN